MMLHVYVNVYKHIYYVRIQHMSQVDRNNGKTTWIALRIASMPTLFSKSGPQELQAVCRPQKKVQEKEIWFQWRSDIGNWGIFWGQRQIVQQKRHWIVREVLESVYHLEGDYVDE